MNTTSGNSFGTACVARQTASAIAGTASIGFVASIFLTRRISSRRPRSTAH